MVHYERLKHVFDVMEEGHLLIEVKPQSTGDFSFVIKECNDAFLSIFSLHNEIVMNNELMSLGVIGGENYMKLATLLDDVYTTQQPGKRDIFFCESLIDATVVATASEAYIDVLVYNWSKRDSLGNLSDLEGLIKMFVNRSLCYMELDKSSKIVRLLGDVEKVMHLNRDSLDTTSDFFQELIYYKDFEMFSQKLESILENVRYNINLRILGQHGEKVWLRLDYMKVGTHIYVIIENIDHIKTLESAYHNERETLRSVQKLTQTGEWEWDALSDQYRISEGLMTLLDVAPKELEAVRALYKDRLISVSSEMSQTMMGKEHVYPYLKENGDQIWLHDKHEKKYDTYGNLTSIFGVTQEVTEDKKLYDQIISLNAEYESIYHSVKAGILVVDVLENGHFEYTNANTEALQLFDLDMDEIVGRSPESIMGNLGHQLLYHYTNCAKNKESIRVLEKLNRYGHEYRIIVLLSPTIKEDRVIKIVASVLENF